MKIVLVAGEPATGKTTLAQSVIKELGYGTPFKDGLVVGTKHVCQKDHPGGPIYVVGVYGPGRGFWGTDKLSMAVMPQLKSWLRLREARASVFMEGDRVTSKSFIGHLLAEFPEVTVIVLTAGSGTLNRRHLTRGDTQSEIFLKGRRTKINSIVDSCAVKVFHEKETEEIRDFVLDKLGASKKEPSTSDDLRI